MPSEPGKKSQSARKPNIPVVYWDSCVFIDWLEKKKPDRIKLIDPLVSMAQNGELKIITSVIAEAEVTKWPEEGISDREANSRIADFFKSPWIIRRSVDTRVIGAVRQIRLINNLKLWDAIHVATALISEVSALHTFDHDDLLKRTGKFTIDGKFFLKIVKPENPIPPPPVPLMILSIILSLVNSPTNSNPISDPAGLPLMPPTILDQIVVTKHQEVAAARLRLPIEELEAQAAEAPPVRDFRAALVGPGPIQLIAEVKKASPSASVIRADFDPIAIARTYQAHGAACLSVLTDVKYFQGHLSYLARIRASVAIPILRKDFLIDEYQVVEARMAGADAILLIAEILNDAKLASLLDLAKRWGMAALVEFHDPVHLPRVLASGADLIGVNNRDLHRFVTDLDLTLRLRDQIPPDVVLVAESGIRNRADVERLEAAGVPAMLVGETLMRADDIGLAVEELLGLVPEVTAT